MVSAALRKETGVTTLAKDLNVADASRLASKFRLLAVHISGVQGRVTTAGDLSGEFGWKFIPMALSWDIADGQLRVVVPVTIHVVRGRDEKQQEHIAEVGVLLRLDYEQTAKGESDAAIDSFVGISGCLHVWPYIRSEIQQLSTKLELPPLLLPPIVSGNVANVVEKVGRIEEPPTKRSNQEPTPPRASKKKKARKKK